MSEDWSQRASKQYFRNARRIRNEWRPGRLRRFPWRGIGGLSVVGLCESTYSTILQILCVRARYGSVDFEVLLLSILADFEIRK